MSLERLIGDVSLDVARLLDGALSGRELSWQDAAQLLAKIAQLSAAN